MSVTRAIMIAGLACTLFGGAMLAKRAMSGAGSKPSTAAAPR
jgi:hypothetical protein